ncbi:LLM class F420-dependent oxidoreductase [Streptosporangium sp. CA-115845]|uniref:LLM class F420-dependent oxidoreductase n=1 Tax=Streptosporangium sp. CA-115845 TaxID=3240071 RepID=UPI003D941A2F
MRIAMQLGYGGPFKEAVNRLVDFEKAGLDMVSVAEAYSFDAVSQLGYLAARTERLEITSGIMQIYSRTPTLTAMTAAGLDHVSDGRFTLGIGASNPQVVEGFHGVRYDAPLGRTRELVEICRQVWRREKIQYTGTYYHIPAPPDQGTGLGKPLKIIDHPVRECIPISIAAIGPRNVALAAEIAEGWEPIFFHPEKASAAWGDALAEGRARRDPALGELDIAVGVPLAFTENPVPVLDTVRPQLALYIGGMGAPGRNFYNDLARRYGYEAAAIAIQDLYLDGKKDEAAAAVPDDLVRATSLIGPRSIVAERVAALREAGVTTVKVQLLGATHAERLAAMEELRDITGPPPSRPRDHSTEVEQR